MAEKNLRDVFGDIKSISGMGEFESWEADDYGIFADDGYPFYASFREGFMLSVVHQDDCWSAAVYGMGYGDCYCCEYADDAQAALLMALDAIKNTIVSI